MQLALPANSHLTGLFVVRPAPARSPLLPTLPRNAVNRAFGGHRQTGAAVDVTGAGQSVDMLYERVAAYNCVNRYVNNSSNNANLNHPAFGCSVASNIVQSVTDKRQFTNPALLDMPAAGR